MRYIASSPRRRCTRSPFSCSIAGVLLLLGFTSLLGFCDAFTLPPSPALSSTAAARGARFLSSSPVVLQSTSSSSSSSSEGGSSKNDVEDEIDRLKTMAARLRAEAAALEAEQAAEIADASERAFRKFDTNQDGEISLEELKAGLEKAFKKELPDGLVRKLMKDFDASGDGALQLDEFVTVDQFRNKLDALAREEKADAREKAKVARLEEEAAKVLQAQMELINDKPPTASDKFLSIIPYLLPLLDGLSFARFLVVENPDTAWAELAAVAYGAYRSVPLGGFIGLLSLSVLSGNFSINRLIRYNMQQAIFLDISLFFFSLFGLISQFLDNVLGLNVPDSAKELGTDAAFFTLLACIVYATISSLLGINPDKISFVSQSANARMPTIDMFDAEGRFIGEQRAQGDDDDDDGKAEDKKKDDSKKD